MTALLVRPQVAGLDGDDTDNCGQDVSAVILGHVLKTSARALRMLSLLQVRREWSGDELGTRLDVDVRTIRRDVDRLRQLGYVIDASAGPGGGYRLSAGTATPPLLLDDDEAVAVAVALGAAAGSVASTDEVALRVLAKLDQLLPRRVRRRLSALPAVTVSLVSPRSAVSLNVLSAVAAACRDNLQLRFAYRDSRGAATARVVEPMRLVHTGRRWYLAAWDVDRGDWRTFRVDRVEAQPRLTQGARFVPRQPPEDFATLVSRSIAASPYRYRARLRVRGSVAEIRERVPPWFGVLEPIDDGHCVLTVGGDTVETIAALIVQAGVEFTLLEPAELAQPIRDIAARLLRGTHTE
jgi:predicted DNA-binding transcriptional regulator YafY